MSLDLSSLSKAIEFLERTIKVAERSLTDGSDEDTVEALRAGVIQNFEFTYELCWKFMRRWLEVNLGTVYVEGVSRRELFRLSAEHRLITDVERWMEYHEDRNETAHTYNEETAQAVYVTACEFVLNARLLLESLEARND